MKSDQELRQLAVEFSKDRGLDAFNAALTGIYQAHYDKALNKIKERDNDIIDLNNTIKKLNEEIKKLNSYGNDE